MVSTMITRNAGRRTAVIRGGGTREQDGREGESQGGGRDGQESDQGSQESRRCNEANGGGGGVPEFATIIAQQLQNLLPTIVAQAGNHVNNQGNNEKSSMITTKGGAIVYTRWIEKMESVQDMSGCGENQKVKYTASSFIGKPLTWWNSQVQNRGQEVTVCMTWEDFKTFTREELCPNNEMQKLETEFWCYSMVGAIRATYIDLFHELARLVPYLVTLENKRIEVYIYDLAPQIRAMVTATEPTTIQSVVLKVGMLTDEAIRNGALKNITEKRVNNEELNRDGNARDDNKRSRTERAFAIITNPVRKEYTDHYKAARPRLKRAPRLGGNHPNQVMAIKGGQGHRNNGNQTRGRDFVMGAYEACQDPNIVTVRITLPNDEILRVLGERPEEEVRHSKSVKVKEKKLKDIVVIRNFFKVFPDDLTGLPPSREIEFYIDIIPRAIPVVKSPYRLAPSKMEELSSQLRELRGKGFI
ncbi:reverse transcriptase domain-containing protein [Tanacetum coccineum]